MSKIDHSLFAANEHALAHIEDVCPKCQSPLTIKHSKKGPFLGCSQYPSCDFAKPLHEHETADIKIIEGSVCPLCSQILVIKKGRYGLFIGCSNYPTCSFIESNKHDEDEKYKCPSCKGGYLIKRANKFGKSFYPCDQYPKCKYALNAKPIASPCPACNWPLRLVKKTEQGQTLLCPQRQCGHKQTVDDRT
jgi:putative DNA topoisomerase